jgi:hypothetical protein
MLVIFMVAQSIRRAHIDASASNLTRASWSYSVFDAHLQGSVESPPSGICYALLRSVTRRVFELRVHTRTTCRDEPNPGFLLS